MAEHGLSEKARVILGLVADLPATEQAAMAFEIARRQRTPHDLSFDELDDALRVATADLRCATDEAMRERLTRVVYDISHEQRIRQPSRWLGGHPDAPRPFPAGLGKGDDYPGWVSSIA